MSPIAAAQSRFAGITPCALKNPLEPSSPCSEKPIIISSSSCSFERDSRHQCLKSKSFFLKLNLQLIMVSYLSVSHLTQVIHDFLSCVSQETAHYENVTVRLCTIHCCVCHVKTSLEEQESSERASTKLSIAQAPEVLLNKRQFLEDISRPQRACSRTFSFGSNLQESSCACYVPILLRSFTSLEK